MDWNFLCQGALVPPFSLRYMGRDQRGETVMPRPKKKGVVGIKIRLATELVSELEAAAKKRGHSFNAEAAIRLGKSFGEEEAFGGEAGRRWMHFITDTFVFAGERYYRDRISKEPADKARKSDVSLWIENPEVYAAAMMSVIQTLMLQQPKATEKKCMLQLKSLEGRIASHFLEATEHKSTWEKMP
jgi:hypothetical protein